MNLKIYIYLILPSTLLLSIIWIFIFKKFIFNKKMLFSLKAIEFLENNELSISRSFFKKIYIINAWKYFSLMFPICIFNCSFAITIIYLNLEINILFKYISFLISILFPTIISIPLYKWLKLNIHYKMYKIKNIINRFNNSFFTEINDDWKNNDFIKTLNNEIIIEFKNSKPKVSERINLDKIRKMCFRKNKFNAYNLNYLMFKNIDHVYINNKKLSSYEQLSLLRIYLFDMINKSKPYFD